MTAVYCEIGRRIVEFEQGGEKRAELTHIQFPSGSGRGAGFGRLRGLSVLPGLFRHVLSRRVTRWGQRAPPGIDAPDRARHTCFHLVVLELWPYCLPVYLTTPQSLPEATMPCSEQRYPGWFHSLSIGLLHTDRWIVPCQFCP